MHLFSAAGVALFSLFMRISLAQNDTFDPLACNIDQGSTKPLGAFDFYAWLNRGICVHSAVTDEQCSLLLEATLGALDQRHSVEYNAASSILALLPTIGALFGTPNSEIWMLSTIFPIGGVLAMLLSFGGSIMPSKVEEYESALAAQSVSIGKEDKNHRGDRPSQKSPGISKGEILKDQILRQMSSKTRTRLPRLRAFLSLLAMYVLFAGAQAAMVIVILGSVYSTGCTITWWLHIWYIIGKFSSACNTKIPPG